MFVGKEFLLTNNSFDFLVGTYTRTTKLADLLSNIC